MVDIVLTGHEHVASLHTQEGERTERNEYIEGAALQDSYDADNSAFNTIIIDTTIRKQKFIRLSWNGEYYAPVNIGSSTISELEWQDFQVNRLRQRARFELTSEMIRSLDDPGMILTHNKRGPVKLSDIYTFPGLSQIMNDSSVTPRVIHENDLIDLINDTPRLLIVGDSLSGKTSLAKSLFRQLHTVGYVPILLDRDAHPPADERLFGYLHQTFIDQYGPSASDDYQQLDRSRRVVIIDDYDQLPLSRSARRQFPDNLARFAGHVILIADSLKIGATDFLPLHRSHNDQDYFTSYRILPFGYLDRDDLVSRWVLLDPDADSSDGEFVRQVTAITRTLDIIIGKIMFHPILYT